MSVGEGKRRGRGPVQSMAFSETDRIVVRGYDLADELIGKVDFTSMVVLELIGRMPTPEERRIVDAVLVTVAEHGVTPSSISTRLTYMSAPEALQGAVAAGLLGAGGVFLGAMEGAAEMLQGLVEGGPDGLPDRVAAYVRGEREAGRHVPGIGHPIHRPEDPRTPVLFGLADELGFGDGHRRCLALVRVEAEAAYGTELPVNAGGAIAAVISDAGLPWRICRGLALIARAAGLVGHVMDEIESPTGRRIWNVVDEAIPYEDPRPGDDGPA